MAALTIIDIFSARLKKLDVAIGHLKFWINDIKISFTTSGEDRTDQIKPQPAVSCELVVNARAQVDDKILKSMMEEAIAVAADKYDVRIGIFAIAHFKPAYPKPEHRLL